MEVHWGEKSGHTRVFYLKLLTSTGNSLTGGTTTDSSATVTAPAGFQLGGFYGQDGDEVDLLGAIWTRIDAAGPGTVAPGGGSASGSGSVSVDVGQSEVGQTEEAPDASVSGSDEQHVKPSRIAGIELSDVFGGPHGSEFTDEPSASSGQTVSSITVRGADRVDGVSLTISAPTPLSFRHGGNGGSDKTLALADGEFVTSMEAHWGQHNAHTRVFYLKFTTNKGNSVSNGKPTDEQGVVTAPNGYQLSGFFGRDGDEIDRLGAIWTSIKVVEATATEAPEVADEDIQLSALHGGPHGTAFSDINTLVLEQTIGGVTIRSDKRVDAVSLHVTDPAEVYMVHGGTGGTDKTLVLASGEYINSIEAHWDKKNDLTRVFYLNLGTNLGNSISGVQTNNKGSATAPAGYQLGGFFGRAGDEVDQIGAIWTRIGAKGVSLTDDMGTDIASGSGSGFKTYSTSIRNWHNICPLGYGKDGDDCITYCPMAYPVTCGDECLPQNGNCLLDTLKKIFSVIAVALNAATDGVFGEILTTFKEVALVINCATNIVKVTKALLKYLTIIQESGANTHEALLDAAYQSDAVVVDLPVAVCACLGIPVPSGAKYASAVLSIVENIVKEVVTNGDEITSDAQTFMNFLKHNVTADTAEASVEDLKDLLKSNTTCGWELKRLTDRVIATVSDLRNKANAAVDDIRVTVSKSDLVLYDIPKVTNNCMGELLHNKTQQAAFETRDLIRKTFGVIIDQLVETGKTDMDKSVSSDDNVLNIADMGLSVLSTFDPTGLAYMASQFIQPTCGPTSLIGEIDDGALYEALGLQTDGDAFEGSYGTWTKSGDGVVNLSFESTDTKDVTVVVHSGGDQYAKVDVGAGDTVSWNCTIPELEDRTMYLDRWRPGLFGLPGTGGGSLLMWVPRSTEGGHIKMHVRINPS
ncbi:hypothetical protein PF005_g9909 [Phytophthora fragariae]|nr:hypothetical protein PF009_g10683 [Phytophthora fragariae]KAE9012975.1 hypothetical protein PF011_g8673 [Phytophthora fragariae]KAE9145995.1 hypothetical protein PF006_g9200 [Phytophthora fragariae]KAE9214216.1 hypothetical protein PF005_g9909 [Phytophthora fragariae]KAE9308227.1 hypothetical protein PF001_g11257 [Phytophthora fragariae]